jgi:hypothetical protein
MITIGGLSLDEAKRVLEYLTALREGPVIGLPGNPTHPPERPWIGIAEGNAVHPDGTVGPLVVAQPAEVITFATLLQRITTERVPAAKIKAALGDKMLPAIATDEAEVRRVYDELFGS